MRAIYSIFPRIGVAILITGKIALRSFWVAYQLTLGFVFIALLVGLFKLANYTNLFQILRLSKSNPGETSFMRLERDRITAEKAQEPTNLSEGDELIHSTWLPWEAIPNQVKEMVVVAEDGKFYKHYGFDFEQIEYAIVANRQQRRRFRGASTISQQVVKNLYLTAEKSYGRKIKEAVMTAILEATLSKDRILEIYLNIAQFGPGVFGVEEGAKYFFGKEVKSLNFGETVSLISVLPRPSSWRPGCSSLFYHRHRVRILKNLNRYHSIRRKISNDEYLAFEKFAEEEARLRWSRLRNQEQNSAALPGDSALLEE